MKKHNSKTEHGRREFIRGMLRTAAMAGLAAVGLISVLRRPAPVDHRCVNRGICSGCGRSGRCILPQAVSARRNGRKPDTGNSGGND